MYKLNSILENRTINQLISDFKRSPNQLNKPHESDAEILKLNNTLLAVTTDSISEEISQGLYDDPYLVGWMIVTVNMSDLAAVGATPLGILISEIIPKHFKEEKNKELQKGISDACNTYNTFVLGGDTNEGDCLVLTGTAIGIINQDKPISRIGCKPNDIVYTSGRLGSGNAYAISKLISQTNSFSNYKPLAQLKYANVNMQYASCCMDTSDGLITTLDQLMRLNNYGFELDENLENAIDIRAFEYSKNLNIPPWLLFAGQHGEFELIFTIPNNTKDLFLKEAFQNSLNPIELGKVIHQKEIKIPLYDELISMNTTFIRNLPIETNSDVNHYLKMLLEYDYQIKNEPCLKFTSP
ncbi:MAG: thiamine-monophosphate kinase [Ignavibacteriaceae bacterium]|nr:thiamine-phosphate kinase [Ignavibacteria bacterium]NNJ54071.1 thiamine-monophosphate kinase [Ignavibacteriaceae bacterium]